MVMFSWLWSYLTTEYGARLITGDDHNHRTDNESTSLPQS